MRLSDILAFGALALTADAAAVQRSGSVPTPAFPSGVAPTGTGFGGPRPSHGHHSGHFKHPRPSGGAFPSEGFGGPRPSGGAFPSGGFEDHPDAAAVQSLHSGRPERSGFNFGGPRQSGRPFPSEGFGGIHPSGGAFPTGGRPHHSGRPKHSGGVRPTGDFAGPRPTDSVFPTGAPFEEASDLERRQFDAPSGTFDSARRTRGFEGARQSGAAFPSGGFGGHHHSGKAFPSGGFGGRRHSRSGHVRPTGGFGGAHNSDFGFGGVRPTGGFDHNGPAPTAFPSANIQPEALEAAATGDSTTALTKSSKKSKSKTKSSKSKSSKTKSSSNTTLVPVASSSEEAASATITSAPVAAAAVTAFPSSSGTSKLDAPKTITGTFDGGMVKFGRGVSCSGQEEGGDSDAVFELEEGAVLKNVIIGADQMEGVHCLGACTIENVWWEAVCEDALTIKQTSGTSYVIGGGAQGADDKVIQHNGGGTVSISGFYVSEFGKLYRSCGNCKTMYERHVIVDGVVAQSGKLLTGINSNYGDTSTITNTCATDVKAFCTEYEGNNTGDEPTQISSGPSDACKYTEADVAAC